MAGKEQKNVYPKFKVSKYIPEVEMYSPRFPKAVSPSHGKNEQQSLYSCPQILYLLKWDRMRFKRLFLFVVVAIGTYMMFDIGKMNYSSFSYI